MKHKIAAIILSVVLVLLIGVQLVDFTAFALSAPMEPLLNPGGFLLLIGRPIDACCTNQRYTFQ